TLHFFPTRRSSDLFTLLLLQLIYFFFNRSFSDKANDLYNIFLPKPVSTTSCLVFYCWVPPYVKQTNGICPRQVYSCSTCFYRTQNNIFFPVVTILTHFD